MNIKKEFGIAHLIDIYPFIDCCYGDQFSSNKVYHYSHVLKETPLTESMFQEGGIFLGFKRVKTNEPLVNACYVIDRKISASFYKPYIFEGKEIVKIEVTTIKPNRWQTDKSVFIQNLADLARLTSDSPIPLR